MAVSPSIDEPSPAECQAALAIVRDNSVTQTEGAAEVGLAYMTFRRRMEEAHVPFFRVGREIRVWRHDLLALRTHSK